eukprot:1159871-Pelagomonas_calceolata.AAC.9
MQKQGLCKPRHLACSMRMALAVHKSVIAVLELRHRADKKTTIVGVGCRINNEVDCHDTLKGILEEESLWVFCRSFVVAWKLSCKGVLAACVGKFFYLLPDPEISSMSGCLVNMRD